MRKTTHPRWISLFLSVFFLLAGGLWAQESDTDLQPVGHLGGQISCGDAQDGFVYLGQGPTVTVSRTESSGVTQVAQIKLPANVLALKAGGDYLYVVLEKSGGFYVLDIHDPAAIDTLGKCELGSGYQAGVTVSGSHAYVATPDYGLYILDISTPTAPSVQKRVSDIQREFITIDNNAAYLISRLGAGAKFSIYDLSDPLNPVRKSDMNVKHAYSVVATNGTAYISCKNRWGNDQHGLRIFDVSDAANPVEKGYLPTGTGVFSTVIHQNTAYLGMQDSLLVVDVTDATAPKRVGFYAFQNAHGAEIASLSYKDGKLYTAVHENNAPVMVFDVSSPAHPSVWTVSGKAPDVAMSIQPHGEQIYIASLKSLMVYNRNGLAMPVFRTEYFDYPDLTYLAFSGNTLLGILGDGSGIVCIDASDPDQLTKQGEYRVNSWVGHFTVDAKRAYLKVGSRTLEIVDISDPTNPTKLGSTDLTGDARAFAARDTLLFSGYKVDDTNRGVEIYSVADPQQIQRIHTIATPGSPNALWSEGDTLYVGGNSTRTEYFLQLYSVANPASPVLLGEFRGSGKLWDIEKRYDAILVAVEGGSLVRFAYSADAGKLQKVSEAHSEGTQQIATTEPDADGTCLALTTEGASYRSPTRFFANAADSKNGGKKSGDKLLSSEVNEGNYGVEIQKFKVKKPETQKPTLTLGHTPLSYDPICPECKDKEYTIARLSVSVDEIDSWDVHSIQIQGTGSGREDKYVSAVRLYVNGALVPRKAYAADNGTITFGI
ncbi:MAG: hypothetical protein GXO76_08160, partial [Calditrichaeota bacterium]|nr:hypothetical protein [Calditrichota bacterium]